MGYQRRVLRAFFRVSYGNLIRKFHWFITSIRTKMNLDEIADKEIYPEELHEFLNESQMAAYGCMTELDEDMLIDLLTECGVSQEFLDKYSDLDEEKRKNCWRNILKGLRDDEFGVGDGMSSTEVGYVYETGYLHSIWSR